MKNIELSLLSVGQLAAKFDVYTATIRRWCRQGKLNETLRTAGNHRRFASSEFAHLLKENKRRHIGYARVSGHDQKSDLGSGLNCKKPELKKLLKDIWTGKVASITLTHADRLLRFGKELIFLLVPAV